MARRLIDVSALGLGAALGLAVCTTPGLAMFGPTLVLSGCKPSSTAPSSPGGDAAGEHPNPARIQSATAEAPATETDPLKILDGGVKHHALVERQLGFYAVIAPPGYDAPENANRRYPVVVILHGSGSDELQHGSSFSQALGRDGVIYVAPRAPYPHAEVFTTERRAGWTAWPDYPAPWGEFGSETFPTGEIQDLDVPRLYTTWIADVVEDARKRYRTDHERVTVVGHSQGAAFAHLLAAHHPRLVKAYFAYAGYYRETTETTEGPAHAAALRQNGIEALFVHHVNDPVVDAEQTRKLDVFLTQHRVDHTTRMLAGDSHELTPEVLAAARDFVRRACCGETPAARTEGAHSPAADPATLAP